MIQQLKILAGLLFFVFIHDNHAQDLSTLSNQNESELIEQILSFEEYLGYVKQHHPIIKQANLQLSSGEANLLRARGGFDPKIEVDYSRKEFMSTEYYNQLNAAFKIPTWYGIEFKANFENNTGEYLDPSLTVPDGGLFSAGISLSLAKGLLMNDRMAVLKKARFFLDQSTAQRDLLVNELIYEASKAYFEWLEAHQMESIFQNFLINAQFRFEGVKRNVEEGEAAAIDSVEAKIIVQNRNLSLEAARLKKTKASLKVSNYLWLNEVPLLIQDQVIPEFPDAEILSSSLYLEGITADPDFLDEHPKLRSISAKVQGLEIDRALKRNNLLPRLDLQYNLLTQEADDFNNFNTNNYKIGVNFSFPIFLRKERGDLKLSKLKLQDANYERISTSLMLQNKIDATQAEVISLEEQNQLVLKIVSDYENLVRAEERKFQLGESSLFLINSREQKLLETALKANTLSMKTLKARATLYNVLGIIN